MSHNLDPKDVPLGYLKDMVDTYFASDPSNDESLAERMETVKADNGAAYVAAVRADLAKLLSRTDADLEAVCATDLRSYYWPGGDGLTSRQWLSLMAELLATPPDTTRDHRSGSFSE
jgi:hypothetical protein